MCLDLNVGLCPTEAEAVLSQMATDKWNYFLEWRPDTVYQKGSLSRLRAAHQNLSISVWVFLASTTRATCKSYRRKEKAAKKASGSSLPLVPPKTKHLKS